MSRGKKSFDGEFLRYYNIIKSHGDATIMEIYNYTDIADGISSLYWEGESKESVQDTVKNLDGFCKNLNQYIDNLIKKTKIIFGVLYPELDALKAKIELYNDTLDKISQTQSLISQAEKKEVK